MSDTIAAIATGEVLSGIGVIRLSGDDAIEIVSRVFTPQTGVPMTQRKDRQLVYGTLREAGGTVIDLCLCTVSRGPRSYTGENTAELQCHGSPVALRQGLEALFAAGARQAGPGEFTRRAFLNGRMDLTQAEAVIDLIHAQTPEAVQNAAGQLGGAIRRKTDAIYESLRDISAHYQAVVDYPDEDIEDFQLSAYRGTLSHAQRELEALLRSFDRGRVLTDGVAAVIAGRPNAGKSSLLNALLGYDRAIVTAQPGATRDTITERIRLGGVLLRLTDTAGLRDATDDIERMGVERSRQAMEHAGLILVLADSSVPSTAEDENLLQQAVALAPTILVKTKADLPLNPAFHLNAPPEMPAVTVSAITGAGLDTLEETVASLFPAASVPAGEILTNTRHYDAVSRALSSIRAAGEALTLGIPPDAVLTETECAMSALGELSGRTVRQDITDRIFERFCVGK